METRNYFNDDRGFTLVELLVAVCVMAIAFAGLATMQIACINGNSIANNVTTGMTLAQDKMEELKSLDYNDPELANNNASNDLNLEDATDDSALVGYNANSDDGHREIDIDAEGNAGGMYTRFWNISDDTPTTGMKTISVVVTWTGHKVTASSIK